MRNIGHAFDRVLDYLTYFGCALVAIAFLAEAAAILIRFFLHISISWTVELNEYVIDTITFLCAAWILKKERHVSIDAAVTILSPRQRLVFNSFISIIGAAICLVAFWYGIVAVREYFQRGTLLVEKSLSLPLAPFLTVVPAGFVLLFIQFLRRSYAYFSAWRDASKEILLEKKELSEL